MKYILITGANKGIGFETARQLAQLGHYIYLGSRDKTNGNNAAKALNDEGLKNVEAIEIDVTNTNSIDNAAAAIKQLDILINNAGIVGEQPQSFTGNNIENIKNIFETNFFGAIQTTQAFLPLLRKSKAPVIVNVSSEVGSLTINNDPSHKGSWNIYNGYGSSKAALNAFTIMLANDLKDANFKVNSATPGYTATDLNNHQGTKTVAEGAKAIIKAATITNETTGNFLNDEGQVPW